MAVAAAAVLFLSYGGAAYGAPGGGKGGGGGKGDSAAISGDFDNNCKEFDADSDKDISNVVIEYQDGTTEKQEFQPGKKSFSKDSSKPIKSVTVKSGTKSQKFECPQCQDGRDNDGDGKIDFDRNNDGARDDDADPGCESEDDNSESPDPTPVPQCRDNVDNDNDGKTDFAGGDPGCESADDNSESPDPTPVPQCRDNVDNDNDGKTDFAGGDPGCESADDNSESPDPTPVPQCRDNVDNDNDGKTDFAGGDPGCESADDDSESPDPTPVPQCRDNVDNDNDGKTDFAGGDPGCENADDDSELDGPPVPQCRDNVDNDNDGKTDFAGGDPGCENADDDSESPDPTTAGNFSCRASALRIENNALLTALGQPVLEPVVANENDNPCNPENETLVDTGNTLTGPPGTLRAQALEAETTETDDGATASSSVARVRITNTAGVELISARLVGSSATATCDAQGNPQLEGESSIVALNLNGQRIVVPDEEVAIPVPGVGTLFLNYQEEKDGVLTQRAIFLDTNTPLGDVIVAESVVDVHGGNPC
jgi:hypothetical protein